MLQHPANIAAIVIIGRARCSPNEGPPFLSLGYSKGPIDAMLGGNAVDCGRIVSSGLGGNNIQRMTPISIPNIFMNLGISVFNIAEIGDEIVKMWWMRFVDLS